ncbi:hypothetical protein HRbin29_01521 [bacterium HR29]|jgi:nitrous oxidase accessory protein|nr:hypothetical protein HRbin29_01521 [bacterium HR29]
MTTTRDVTLPARAADAPRQGILARYSVPDAYWTVSALVAAVLLGLSMLLPLWKLKLVAPQYPNGLYLTAYGYRMEGDIEEINRLNHYIGMKPIEPDSVWELKLFLVAMPVLIALTAAAAFLARRRLHRTLIRALLWTPPLFFLADLQYWLYEFGHDLDPKAALRMEPFTPKVIGPTRVMNFGADTMVDWGFWAMVGAAVVITFGPALARWFVASWKNTGPSATAALLLVVGAWAALPTRGETAADFPGSIAEAIARAAPGDTLIVPPGTYHEQITIDKPITLVGEGRPVIDGGGRGDVIVIAAEGVTLRGFVIRGSARDVAREPAGIRVTAPRATIEGNELRDVLYGISLLNSGGHVVRNNRITSIPDLPPERRGHAIYLFNASDCLVENNVIRYGKDGLFLGFSDHNLLRGNDVSDVRYGIHYMYADHNEFHRNRFTRNIAGAAIMFSRGIVLRENVLAYNRSGASGYGILLKDVDDVTIEGNFIHHNRLALTADGAPRSPQGYVSVRGNFIGYNQVALELFTTADITFTGNTFLGNLEEVRSLGGDIARRNRWALDGRGNYWDSYRGFDADGDGIGDLPFTYKDAFADLRGENAAVQAYAFTPAHTAIQLASRWFPALEPEVRLVDPAPLMEPPVTLSTASSRHLPALGAAVGLAAAGTLPVAFARRIPVARRW